MFKRIISAILVLCVAVSFLTVFCTSPSAETTEEGEAAEPQVLFNRTFSEGWDYNNGLTRSGDGQHDYRINYKSNYDFTYNYYLTIEAKDNLNGFLSLSAGGNYAKKGEVQYIEFDIMANEGCNIGGVYQTVSPGSGSDRAFYYLISYKNGYLYIFDQKVCPASSTEWVHIAIALDYGYESENYPGTKVPSQFKATVYCSKLDEPVEKICANGKGGCGVSGYRIGCEARSGRNGHWVALDNLQVYHGTNGFVELDQSVHGYGTAVKETAAKTIEILGETSEVELTLNEKLVQSLAMKTGVDYCYDGGKRKPIYTNEDGEVYGAPERVDGQVMLPLERILDFFGYPYYLHPDGMSFDISTGESATYLTVGRSSATVDGKRIDLCRAPGYVSLGGNEYLAVALDDFAALFPGFHLVWDDMGLIVVSEYENLLTREENLSDMVDLMTQFVFDFASPDTIYEMTKEHTENFTHPYLYADGEKFAELREVYNTEYVETDDNYNLKRYITTRVNSGISNYKSRVLLDDDGNYAGIKPASIPVNPNDTPDGYDAAGGRLSVPSGFLQDLGFAVQITGDANLAKFAYDYIVALGKWDHWGPGHFLNCADASAPVAACIDWIHNCIVGLNDPDYNMDVLYEVLWEDGVNMGYLAALNKTCPWPSAKQASGFVYHKKANNWNAVCSSGMIISALVLMAYDKYIEQSSYLISDNIYHLVHYGMDQYIPDGSYVESPGYWAYGTNSMFKMCAALISATGSDFGYMDCWGIDRTCYFACHAESSNYQAFSYHDGGTGSVDTSYFAFVAQTLGDEQLMQIRKFQLKNGKGSSLWDVLHYVPGTGDSSILDLQYYMEGIDGYTLRSSWEKGAIFAGILAGDNNAPHGQYDSGTWVYHSHGIIWFYDLGADNYNIKSYFGNGKYYRISSEGNNVLVLASSPAKLPYGQAESAVGKVTDHGDNEHGAYCVVDNNAIYAGLTVTADRGIMMTNDRKTFVIQDEVSLKGIQSLYWFGHYDTDRVRSVRLSTDKKTAYMEATDASGNLHTLRATLVSPVKSLRFSLMNTYEFVLAHTMTGEQIKEVSNGQEEYARYNFMKLAIKAEEVLSFKAAVVIEEIDPEYESEVGYTWTEMANWNPSADIRGEIVEVDEKLRAAAKLTDIITAVKRGENCRNSGVAFADRVTEYYRAITDMVYAVESFKDLPELPSSAQQAKETGAGWAAEYDAFAASFNTYVESCVGLMRGSIFGM